MTPGSQIAFLKTEHIDSKKVVGFSTIHNLVNPNTVALWQKFMPLRNEIKGRVSGDLLCIQNYSNPEYFSCFNPENEFETWAVAEVTTMEEQQTYWQHFEIPSGLYAVFIHKGGPSTFSDSAAFIYGEWLPASGYTLDNRPHFEILGAKYIHNDPNCEEEVWIPVCAK